MIHRNAGRHKVPPLDSYMSAVVYYVFRDCLDRMANILTRRIPTIGTEAGRDSW